MHAAGAGVDHLRQLVGIGALELGELPRFEQDLRQRVVERQFGEHFLVGRRRPRRRLLLHRQAELVEQDLGQLLRRVDVERLPGRRVRACFEFEQALADFVALLREQLRIDQHAGTFHAEEDVAHRHFDRLVDCAEPGVGGDLRIQPLRAGAGRDRHLRRRIRRPGRSPPGRSRSGSRPCRTALRRESSPGRDGGSRAGRGHARARRPCRIRGRTIAAACRAARRPDDAVVGQHMLVVLEVLADLGVRSDSSHGFSAPALRHAATASGAPG
jgi:hypothetical protein